MIDPETLAAENGFSHWAQMNMAAAVPLAEVRDMCAADRCGRYGHNWACPPGCGSIEAAARRIWRAKPAKRRLCAAPTASMVA